MTPDRPRAVMLAHRIPFPPDKGDKIRSWRVLRFLAERFDVSLGCFIDDDDDWRHTDAVRAVCDRAFFRPLRPAVAAARAVRGLAAGDPITLARYRDVAMRRWIDAEMAQAPLLTLGFSAGVMPYLLDRSHPATTVFADLCDADSAKWTAYGRDGRGIRAAIYAREGRRLAKTEALITREADRTFLVTPEEAAIVAALPGADRKRVGYFRNGVDTEAFAPGVVPPLQDPPTVVMTGAMDYRPNADGAVWFVREVWPMVRERFPHARFAIVGARPSAEVAALSRAPGVTVTGRVADVRPWLGSAKVAVAPLTVARGVQNKVLEALAMGTPLVASPAAAAGAQAVAGTHYLEAATADETADAVIRLLTDKAAADRLGSAGRRLATGRFGWEAALSRLGAAIDHATR